MQLTLHDAADLNLIRAHSQAGVQINKTVYAASLLVLPDLIEADWPVTSVTALDQATAESLLRHQPDLILLGAGAVLQFPNPAFQRTLLAAGVGCEVMDTAAACRTYNVLVSEGRRALAALIV